MFKLELAISKRMDKYVDLNKLPFQLQTIEKDEEAREYLEIYGIPTDILEKTKDNSWFTIETPTMYFCYSKIIS